MIVWKPDGSMSSSELMASGQLPSSSLAAFFTVNSTGGGVAWIRKGVMWAVALQNVEALKILLACGYAKAALLVVAGVTARWFTSLVILSLAGLELG